MNENSLYGLDRKHLEYTILVGGNLEGTHFFLNKDDAIDYYY